MIERPTQSSAKASVAAILMLAMVSGAQSSQSGAILPGYDKLPSHVAPSSARRLRFGRIKNDNPALWSRIADKQKDPVPAKPAKEFSPTESSHPRLGGEIVKRLLAWIVVKTGLSVKQPPTIRFVPAARLVELYYGKNKEVVKIGVKGLYDNKSHIVRLLDSWDSSNLRDLSYLLHELVHHLQVVNNVEVECQARYDLQAYHLQFEWLHEQGIQDPYEFLNINQVTVFAASQCPHLYGY